MFALQRHIQHKEKTGHVATRRGVNKLLQIKDARKRGDMKM